MVDVTLERLEAIISKFNGFTVNRNKQKAYLMFHGEGFYNEGDVKVQNAAPGGWWANMPYTPLEHMNCRYDKKENVFDESLYDTTGGILYVALVTETELRKGARTVRPGVVEFNPGFIPANFRKVDLDELKEVIRYAGIVSKIIGNVPDSISMDNGNGQFERYTGISNGLVNVIIGRNVFPDLYSARIRNH